MSLSAIKNIRSVQSLKKLFSSDRFSHSTPLRPTEVDAIDNLFTGDPIAPQVTRSWSREDWEKIVSSSVWVYAAVKVNASAAASVSMDLFRKDATGKKRRLSSSDKGHYYDCWRLFQRPNPDITGYQLRESAFFSLELSGNAFWEKVRWPSSKRITALYSLVPSRTQVVLDAAGRKASYLYTNKSGKDVSLSKENVEHFRYTNPFDEHYGLGAVMANEKAILIDMYSELYQEMFFRNNAQLGLIVSFTNGLTKEQKQLVEKKFQEKYTGAENAFRALVTTGNVDVKHLHLSQKEMDLNSLRKWNRDSILAAFLTPKQLLGITDGGESVGESNAARRNFWEITTIPKLKSMQEQITAFTISEFSDDIWAEFDFLSVEAMTEEADKRSNRVSTAHMTGLLSRHEARHRAFPDLANFEGGDLIHGPANYGIVGDTRIPPSPAAEIISLQNSIRSAGLNASSVAKRGVSIQKQNERTDVEAAIAVVVDEFFLQMEDLSSRYDTFSGFYIPLTVFSEEYVTSISDVLSSASTKSVYGNILREFGDGGSVNYTEDLISAYVKPEIRSIVNNWTQKTVQGFAKEVAANPNFKSAVEDYFNRLNSIKETLSTTLSTSVLGAQSHIFAELTRKRKSWYNQGDDRVRGNPAGKYGNSAHDHWNMDGQTVLNGQQFIDPRSGVRYRYPGDPLAPFDAIANCRCWMDTEA